MKKFISLFCLMFALCLVSCSKEKKESDIIDMYVNDIAGEYKLTCYSYSYLKVEDVNYLWCCYDPYYIYIVTNEGCEYKFFCYRLREKSYKWQDIKTQRIE